MGKSIEKYTYFDLLSLDESLNIEPEILEKHYLNLQSKYHPDRYKSDHQKSEAANVSQVLNKAYQTLKDDFQRRAYLLSLHGVSIVDEKVKFNTSEEILSEIFELRSKIEDNNNQNELSEFKSFALKAYTDMISKFDHLYLENNHIDCGHFLASALFYQKLIEEINLRMSSVHANS